MPGQEGAQAIISPNEEQSLVYYKQAAGAGHAGEITELCTPSVRSPHSVPHLNLKSSGVEGSFSSSRSSHRRRPPPPDLVASFLIILSFSP